MSIELLADGEDALIPSALEIGGGAEPEGRERPNVSGDLPTVFEAAPMFRRSVVGYDRYQVDTYVQWAEDELATADRERRRLEARSLRTQAALDEAQQLLAHSPAGGDFLQASRRIGSVLATAADEAEAMRVEAEADRAAAAASTRRAVAVAEQLLADADAEAERLVAESAAEAEQVVAHADHLAHQAERTLEAARAEAGQRIERARADEVRAAEDADHVRQSALDDAAAARLRARDEIVRMLETARGERRRADAAAARSRERLDREAAARQDFLVSEIDTLERRRDALRAEIDVLSGPAAEPQPERIAVRLRRLLSRSRVRPRASRAH